jgi:hypothetical protein
MQILLIIGLTLSRVTWLAHARMLPIRLLSHELNLNINGSKKVGT